MSRSASTTRLMNMEFSRAWIGLEDIRLLTLSPASQSSTMARSRRSRSAGARLRARFNNSSALGRHAQNQHLRKAQGLASDLRRTDENMVTTG